MTQRRTYSLFEAWGIEIEAMLVDATSFDVAPVSDRVLRAAEARRTGADPGTLPWIGDFGDGRVEWSNELVAHVVEFKTAEPATSLEGLADAFRASQRLCDTIAREEAGARLVPGAMHPWMDPKRETTLWPHDNAEIYGAYDRMFDCRRHGWANLQSVHLNLPFANDEEFGRLMAAIRVALPLVPALAAASPVIEGRSTGLLDNRLEVYRTNSAKVGAMTGDVVPEQAFDRETYKRLVFDAIDAQLHAMKADEVLFGVEWTNARGAIARFDRMAIEIRLIDAQECAAADVAVAAAVAGLVRGLVDGRWSSSERQREFASAPLVALLVDATARAGAAVLPGAEYAALFGLEGDPPATARDLLRRLVPGSFAGPAELEAPLQVVLDRGTLGERMVAALGGPEVREPSRDALRSLLGRVSDCMLEGASFLP
ncbi:MAG: glutamate-cysteine ligase family protein [Planctomycetota bacterium]